MFENILGQNNIGTWLNNEEIDGPFINDDNSFSENGRRCAFILNKLDGTYVAVISLIHDIVPTNALPGIQSDIQTNQIEEANVKICRYVNRLIKAKEIVNVIKTSLELLAQVIDWAVKHIEETLAQWILVKSQVFVLRSKKFLSLLEEYVLVGIRAILVGISTLKCSQMSSSLNNTINVLLKTAKTLNIGISYVILAIKSILNALPNPISIDAEQICFFMTPKSMEKTICNILNTNKSASDRIPNVVKDKISEIELTTKAKNKILKRSIISAGATAGLACAYTDFEIPTNICNLIEYADTSKIMSLITNILRYSVEPYPLPKYEELLPFVPGYVIWLLSGFIPAGHKSFGIPGYP